MDWKKFLAASSLPILLISLVYVIFFGFVKSVMIVSVGIVISAIVIGWMYLIDWYFDRKEE